MLWEMLGASWKLSVRNARDVFPYKRRMRQNYFLSVTDHTLAPIILKAV